jgi:hypothetical protein
MKNVMGEQEGNINISDLEMFKLVDTADDAVNYILDYFAEKSIKPNF